jgi:hypothetical protein
MISARAFVVAAVAAFFVLGAQVARAEGVATSTVGVAGYDLVSYQTNQKPLRGNGHNVSVHDGVTYLFASAENKATFEADPAKYLPAYGGYCAFGVSVGKKFFGDPEVWRVVDDRLYLNLDAKVQDLWLADTEGKIETADKLWVEIENVPASEL